MRNSVQQELPGNLPKPLSLIQAFCMDLGFEIDLIRMEEVFCCPDPLRKDPAPKTLAALYCKYPAD